MLDEEVTRVLAGMEPANSQARCGRDPWDLILIVSDNGTELTSNAILAWSKDHKVEWHNIARKPNAEWMCRELQQTHARRVAQRERLLRPRSCPQRYR